MTDGDQQREQDRLASLHGLGLFGTPAEDRFDRITSMASRLVGAPISLIALVGDTGQWNKSRVGLEDELVAMDDSLCRHVVGQDAPLVVEDLAEDERFQGNAFVDRGIRFYAGWPLRDGEGLPLGTLCVLDEEPRTLTPEQREVMHSLAEWAQAELNAAVLTRALADVRGSEHRLLTLLDQAPAAVLLVDADERVAFGNVPAVRLFGERGGPGRGLRGVPVRDLLPTVDIPALQPLGRRSSDPVSPGRRFVQRGQRADGSAFVAELTVSTSGGIRSQHIVFVRDLSSEEPSAAELAELRQRSEVAFDALAEGVLVCDAEGRISVGNLAAAQMLQRRRYDLPGTSWHDVVHPDEHPAVEGCEHAAPVALAGRTLSPVVLRRGDGSSLPVSVTVRLLQGLSAAPGVVLTLHDLTERLRNDRLKDEFVSAVSHELRTPLTSIRGSLGLLTAGVIDPASDQGRRMLQIATESTERLSRLVNDILDLERLQAGKVQLQIARQRAGALLVSASQAVSGAAATAGVQVEVLDSDEWVLADTDRAVQVLVNLLGNAVKFSPTGSTVRLSARRADSSVLLSVQDQGRGIPQEELGRIFDRFAQVDASDSRDHQGTGLGLAIAQGLAEQHGGSLTATSTEGVGSEFVLRLPVAAAVRRTVAYCPADEVPEELSRLLAQRGWQARPVRAAQLSEAGAGAFMLADADPRELRAVRARAAELRLPLLVLTTAEHGLAASVLPEDLQLAEVEGRVLVVEDDVELSEVLCTALQRRGLQTRQASTQEQAVQSFLDWRPDLVVLDIVLDGGDGFGVVDALRAPDLPDLGPVIVYTVLELDESERARLQTGETSFLTKGRHRVDDVVRDVTRLLGAAARDEEDL